MTALSNPNIDIAQKQLDAYNAQDLDTYVSFFAQDCVVSGLNGTPTETSRDAIQARYAKAFAQFPAEQGRSSRTASPSATPWWITNW